MLRLAALADLPRLIAIRDASGDDALSEPRLVSEALLRRLIAVGTASVWQEGDAVAGFAAVDGDVIHLLVDTAQRNRGLGRALLAAACAAVKETGHQAAVVTLPACSFAAERHYRAAGWCGSGQSAIGGLILKKPF